MLIGTYYMIGNENIFPTYIGSITVALQSKQLMGKNPIRPSIEQRYTWKLCSGLIWS